MIMHFTIAKLSQMVVIAQLECAFQLVNLSMPIEQLTPKLNKHVDHASLVLHFFIAIVSVVYFQNIRDWFDFNRACKEH